MAALDHLETFLKEAAAVKNVTIVHAEHINPDGDVSGRFELHKDGKTVGHLTYTLRMSELSISKTRKGGQTVNVRCIYISFLKVYDGHTGKGLGSLLLASALNLGKRAGCVYSILEDISAHEAELEDNIYAKFGFTHQDVIQTKNGKVVGTMPEKQLELPNDAQLLRNVKARLKMGGTRKVKISRFHRRRKTKKTTF